MITNFD